MRVYVTVNTPKLPIPNNLSHNSTISVNINII